MKLLYVVGFTMDREEGRVIGTRNKVFQLSKKLEQVVFVDLSSSIFFRLIGSYKILRILAKGLGILEINLKLIFAIRGGGFDVIICRDLPLFIGLCIDRSSVLFLSELHADIEEEVLLTRRGLTQRLGQGYARYISRQLKWSDGIIFNHPELEAHIRQQLMISAPTVAVYNGADLANVLPIDKTLAREHLGISANIKLLLFTGSMAVWHGIEGVLQTFMAIPEGQVKYRLIIVGGSNEKYLNELKLEYDDCRIEFVGRVSKRECDLYVKAADMCMLPVNDVRVSPGSPIKLYEYAACGKIIVTQLDTQGYSDIVERYHLGMSVDFNCPAEASRSIVDYLQKHENQLEEMGNDIRETAEAELAWSCRMDDWISFIENMLSRPHNRGKQ